MALSVAGSLSACITNSVTSEDERRVLARQPRQRILEVPRSQSSAGTPDRTKVLVVSRSMNSARPPGPRCTSPAAPAHASPAASARRRTGRGRPRPAAGAFRISPGRASPAERNPRQHQARIGVQPVRHLAAPARRSRAPSPPSPSARVHLLEHPLRPAERAQVASSQSATSHTEARQVHRPVHSSCKPIHRTPPGACPPGPRPPASPPPAARSLLLPATRWARSIAVRPGAVRIHRQHDLLGSRASSRAAPA